MALQLETSLKNAIATTINTECSTGAGTAQFRFQTAADANVASINLQNTVFGSPSNGVIALAGVPLSDTNAAGGTISKFSIYNRNSAKQLQGTVATSGGDVNITNLTVAAGETVELQNFSITVP